MNEHLRITERLPPMAPTTQAAEGLMRRKWSRSEIEAMMEAGILSQSERFELIGGELVPMSPKGLKHEGLKAALAQHWYRKLPEKLRMITETTLWFDEFSFVEPDFLFFPATVPLDGLRPAKCVMAVEVGVSSLAYDRDRKSRLYAIEGLPELWVIDGESLRAWHHREPGIDGYAHIRELAVGDALVPCCSADLAVDLTALDRP